MKAGILLQYSKEFINEIDDIRKGLNDHTSIIRKAFEKQKRDLLIKQSIRVLKWDMRSGQNGDDFVRNLYSVVFTGKGYKVPRDR
jgi:hypothetical protein